MKTIRPFDNTPTIIHVTELPKLNNHVFSFGFNPGYHGSNPTLRVNVDLLATDNQTQIKVATYNSGYEITGEGLVLEDHIYACCEQAIYMMHKFAQFHEIVRTIPQAIFQCPAREAFEDDLIVLAKALNAVEGKRGWPVQKK